MSKTILHALLVFFTISLPCFATTHVSYIIPSLKTNASTPKEGQIVADNGTLYRKLLKITPSGYQVQNFYKGTQQKQTNPFIIKDKKNLSLFQDLEIDHLQNLIFEGPLTLWFNNNTKFMSLYIKDGNAEGAFHMYYLNGQPQIDGQYKAGKAEGLWYYWNGKGELEQKIYYKQGNRQWQKNIINLHGL